MPWRHGQSVGGLADFLPVVYAPAAIHGGGKQRAVVGEQELAGVLVRIEAALLVAGAGTPVSFLVVAGRLIVVALRDRPVLTSCFDKWYKPRH
jgi:hypothetical protein